MRKVKRGVSLLLAVIMLAGVMAVAPFTAGAATEDCYFVGSLTGWQFDQMTSIGNDAFEYEFIDVKAGNHEFKFAPAASWNTSYGVADAQSYSTEDGMTKISGVCYLGNNSSNISLSLDSDASRVKFVFYPDYKDSTKDYVTGRYDIYVTSNSAPVENYVYFVNTKNWAKPYAYFWNSNATLSDPWPGNEMTATDEENVYKYNIGAAPNLIFNGGEGAEQTNNLNAADCIDKYFEPVTGQAYDSAEEAVAAAYEKKANTAFTKTITRDADDNAWTGYTLSNPNAILGVQKKNDSVNDIRFITVISKEIMDLADDYGYVLAKASTTDYEAVRNNADKLGITEDNKITCKNTTNTLSGDFGSNQDGNAYRYVTAAVNNVDNDATVVARFYIVIGGKTYTSKYYTAGNTYDGCAVTPSYFS